MAGTVQVVRVVERVIERKTAEFAMENLHQIVLGFGDELGPHLAVVHYSSLLLLQEREGGFFLVGLLDFLFSLNDRVLGSVVDSFLGGLELFILHYY